MSQNVVTEPKEVDLCVVGGGLAGLAAAATAAKAGARVFLAERSSALGGRARTARTPEGFNFNLGPHALYAGAPGARVLSELGVGFSGHKPRLSGSLAVHAGQLHALPGGFLSLLTTGFLNASAKFELAKLLTSLTKLDTASLDSISLGTWLRDNVRHEVVRQQIAALGRLTAYQNHPDLQSAGASLEQLRTALCGSVDYIDGGWQTLVDGLAEVAINAGAELQTGTKVEGLHYQQGRWRFDCNSAGAAWSARNVILALPPVAASVMLPQVAALMKWREQCVPVEAATLDLALASLPKPRNLFALGIDEPLYFSVHSATAKLAPHGGALIHAAVYLGNDAPQGKAAEQRLERLVDQLQPGWRDHLVERRFLPSIAVVGGLPLASTGGLPGRPGPTVPGQPGLFVAGDWVGGEGLLADAALASGQRAATLALAETADSPSLNSAAA